MARVRAPAVGEHCRQGWSARSPTQARAALWPAAAWTTPCASGTSPQAPGARPSGEQGAGQETLASADYRLAALQLAWRLAQGVSELRTSLDCVHLKRWRPSEPRAAYAPTTTNLLAALLTTAALTPRCGLQGPRRQREQGVLAACQRQPGHCIGGQKRVRVGRALGAAHAQAVWAQRLLQLPRLQPPGAAS